MVKKGERVFQVTSTNFVASFKSSRFKDRFLRLFFLNLGISSSDHVPLIDTIAGYS